MSRGCDQAVEYVYHYLDGELTWSRKVRIRWHLKRCSPCDDAFDFELRLKTMIREKGRDELPPELFDRLRALIREDDADTTV
jgi:mycothiol system anti-sigma-R factor